MLPDEANMAGNVHGGSILRLIDEIGLIASSRYAAQRINKEKSSEITMALSRLNNVDFLNPMHIGDLAQLDARVTATGSKSVEVQVDVFAENISTGKRLQTNRATLWYTMVDSDELQPHHMPPKLLVSPFPVPPMEYASKAEEQAATLRYEQQKTARTNLSGLDPVASIRRPDALPIVAHLVLPSDCSMNKFIFGGVLMKLMDSAAAVVAMRYTKTNMVTANIDSLNMLSPSMLSNIVKVYAHPTFTSTRTLEVAVYVETEDVLTGETWRAVNGHFTFVSLGSDGKVLPIPPLVPLTHESRQDFALGHQRYLKRKAAKKLML